MGSFIWAHLYGLIPIFIAIPQRQWPRSCLYILVRDALRHVWMRYEQVYMDVYIVRDSYSNSVAHSTDSHEYDNITVNMRHEHIRLVIYTVRDTHSYSNSVAHSTDSLHMSMIRLWIWGTNKYIVICTVRDSYSYSFSFAYSADSLYMSMIRWLWMWDTNIYV